jgi:hypothetical protein
MNDSTGHLTQEAHDALGLPIAERCRRCLSDKFVNHGYTNQITGSLEYLLSKPATSRAGGIVASGPAGAGKTMLANAIMRRYQDPTSTSRFAALITMTEAREAKQIYLRLLDALGCPHGDRYTGEKRRELAVKLAREASLRLLVIDEIQDILIGTPRQQQLSLEVIKSLMNTLGVTILALGTPEAKYVMATNEHLRARFQFMELPKWSADEALAVFLRAFESSLPLAEPSRLYQLTPMRTLVKASDGVLTRIVEIVTRAATISLQNGNERITDEFIRRAIEECPKVTWKEEGKR